MACCRRCLTHVVPEPGALARATRGSLLRDNWTTWHDDGAEYFGTVFSIFFHFCLSYLDSFGCFSVNCSSPALFTSSCAFPWSTGLLPSRDIRFSSFSCVIPFPPCFSYSSSSDVLDVSCVSSSHASEARYTSYCVFSNFTSSWSSPISTPNSTKCGSATLVWKNISSEGSLLLIMLLTNSLFPNSTFHMPMYKYRDAAVNPRISDVIINIRKHFEVISLLHSLFPCWSVMVRLAHSLLVMGPPGLQQITNIRKVADLNKLETMQVQLYCLLCTIIVGTVCKTSVQ